MVWDYGKLADGEFAVMLNNGQQILRPPLVHETRPGVVQFRAEPGGNNDKVKLSFKVMQPGDGVLLRLLVGFPFSQLPSNDSDLDVKGVFTDVPKNGAVRSHGRLVLQEPISFRQQCESLAARVLASGLLFLAVVTGSLVGSLTLLQSLLNEGPLGFLRVLANGVVGVLLVTVGLIGIIIMLTWLSRTEWSRLWPWKRSLPRRLRQVPPSWSLSEVDPLEPLAPPVARLLRRYGLASAAPSKGTLHTSRSSDAE